MLHRWITGTVAAVMLAAPLAARADETPKDDPPAKKDDAPTKKGKKSKDKDKDAVIAHIKLAGDLDEAPAGESPFGAAQENLRAKLNRIAKAKTDPSVKALILELGGLGIGFGKVDEVTRAIKEFKESGKKVVAYAPALGGKDYLVAAQCDSICIPESGEVEIIGIRAEITFYKDLFEKLHVKADFLQMGDFKGAAEPYLRSSMSPQFRKQYETVLDDFYEKSFVQALVDARKAKGWTPDAVKKLIDHGVFTADKALAAGLVDKLAYHDEVEAFVKHEAKATDAKVVKGYGQTKAEEIDFSSPLAIFKLLSAPKTKASKEPKVAIIYAVGEIVDGKGGAGLMGGSQVGSVTMVEAIQEAEKDETVKAIVLRVDSPGGSALASDLIWHELRKCKKPVVASMGDVAASGGYYISMACPKIYAEPGTITGSIGVVGGKFVTGGLMDMVGLKTEVIERGKHSGIMSSKEPWSESERKAMLEAMQHVYDQFRGKAIQGRKLAGVDMTDEQLLKLAGGRIWTGRQAKENKLVDELGTLADAIAEAKRRAGVEGKDLEPLILPKTKGFFDKYLDPQGEVKAPALEAFAAVPGVRKHLQTAEAMLKLQRERVWLMAPYRVDVK